MQPMYRVPIPPQGKGTPGAPPQGLPSGLPPPHRPPAGYKPSFPANNYVPIGPPAPLIGPPFSSLPSGHITSSATMPVMNPPIDPPIQKMSDMNLNSSTSSQQGLSNGVADSSNSSSPQISQAATNGDQNDTFVANSTDPPPDTSLQQHSESPTSSSPNDTSVSNSLQQRFRRDSPQGESFLSSQEIFPPVSDINSSFPPSSVNPNFTCVDSHSATLSGTSSASENATMYPSILGLSSANTTLPPLAKQPPISASLPHSIATLTQEVTPGMQSLAPTVSSFQPGRPPSAGGHPGPMAMASSSTEGYHGTKMTPSSAGGHPVPIMSLSSTGPPGTKIPLSSTGPPSAMMPPSSVRPGGMAPSSVAGPHGAMMPPPAGGPHGAMMPPPPAGGPHGAMMPPPPAGGPHGAMMPPPPAGPPHGAIIPPPPAGGPHGAMMPPPPAGGPHGAMMPPSSVGEPLRPMMPPRMGVPLESMKGPPRPMMSPSVGGPPVAMMPPAGGLTTRMMPPSSVPTPGMMMPPSAVGGPPGPVIPPSAAGLPVRSMGPPLAGGPSGAMAPSFVGGSTRPMMPPESSFGGKPQPSMSMAPPRPGMPPPPTSRSAMLPPGSGSLMVGSNSGPHPPRPGMPPPPTSSYLPPPGAPSGVPPPPGVANPSLSSSMGGMQNRYPGASSGSGPVGGYSQGGQGRRLNPDDMPSPLQVIEGDKHCKSGEFLTNIKGAVPPLITTEFMVRDGGNASPRFIRSTMYNIPATPDMMKQASVPFGLVISPLADLSAGEAPIYQGTSLANGPVRCNRCKAYMSPYMMFMDGGRRYQCLLCKQINEVPPDYYCHMDSQGCRADKFQRPELCLGTYEFIATPEYCKDKILPKEPAFIFVMEMSQMMIQRGIINLICENMKSILEHLPRDEVPGQEVNKSSVRVGFITYDSSIHFYKLNGLAPEMCIVCDKENMFVPVPDGVLCDIEEVNDNIDRLMESIPQNFQTTRETCGALSCAINAGMAALKASGRAGKLLVFHSSLPQAESPGKLRNRDDRKLLGTDKEKTILSPQTTHYNNLAQDLVAYGCGVDFYLFNESYIDLATIGQVCRLTGGQCYKYTFFQSNKDGERLLDDLKINISRNIGFESVMRVRTSTGVRPVDFFGHFFMSNTQDIELAAIESNKAVAVEVKHDDKITEEDGVYIQIALLYTSCGGQRRLRIINLALNICTQIADLYKNCELDTLMNFFGKQSLFKFLDSSAKQVKENLIARTAQILACYRKNCASPSSAGQLVLPELMKLLPLYINCLTKCDALSGGQDLTCDDRSWHIYQLCTMTVEASVVYYYPRLVPLTDEDQQQDGVIPAPVRTSYEKLSPDGAYLLENGLFMFLWVGSGTSSTWMKDVFGVSAPHQLDPVLAELPEFDNAASKRVANIIKAIREQRKLHVRLFVVPQQGKHEVVMRNYLVEDKGMFGAPSYVDFLCHVHKEIRALLS